MTYEEFNRTDEYALLSQIDTHLDKALRELNDAWRLLYPVVDGFAQLTEDPIDSNLQLLIGLAQYHAHSALAATSHRMNELQTIRTTVHPDQLVFPY